MIYIAYVIHVITCIFLILVVLFQQGKGADLSVFGGGTTQAAFGARGTATLLHKLTVGFFILFLITTMSIGILQRSRRGTSVMRGLESGEASPVTAPAPIPPDAPGAGADDAAPGDASAAPGTNAMEAEPAAPAGAQAGVPDATAPEEAPAAQPPPGN